MKLASVLLVVLGSQLAMAQSTVGSVSTAVPTGSVSWTGSLKDEVSSNIETAKTIGGALNETQVRLAYKFNDTNQLGILLGGKYRLAADNQNQADQDLISSDLAIAGISVLPSIIGSDKTVIDGRIYLPTSDASVLAKQNFQARADITLPYTLQNQRTLSLYVSPRVTDFQAAATKSELLSQLKLVQGKTIAPYLALNHRVKLISLKAGMTRAEEGMGPEIGLEANPYKTVKLYMLVSQERNILNPTAKKVSADFSAFNTSETKYLVGGQIKL